MNTSKKCDLAFTAETGPLSRNGKIQKTIKAMEQKPKDLSTFADPKVSKIILDQQKEKLVSRGKHLVWNKDHSDRQKALDKKRAVLQDGFLDCDFIAQLYEICSQIPALKDADVAISLGHFCIDMYIADRAELYISAVTHLAHDLLRQYGHLLPTALKFIQRNLRDMFDGLQDGLLFGESTITSLSDLIKTKASLTQTKVWKTIIEFVNYIVCLMLKMVGPESDGEFSHTLKNLVMKPVEFTAGIYVEMFESLIFLLKQGYQSFHIGYPMGFFYEETTIACWTKDINQLTIDFDNLNSPDAKLRKNKITVLENVRKLVEKGTRMRGFQDKFVQKHIDESILKLSLLANDLHNSMVASKYRPAPLCLLINGDPCVGKSNLVDQLQHFYAQQVGLEDTDESRYSRNFGDPFWSELKTTCWCIVMDDIAQENPNKVTSLAEFSGVDVIRLANNVVFAPTMAHLSEKGKVFCMPRLVLATTNTKNLNAHLMFECPYAVMRRFPFVITLYVKPEYRDHNDGIDPHLVPVGCDDVWNILVEKPVKTRGKEPAKYANVLARPGDPVGEAQKMFHTMREFRMWLKETIRDHEEVQARLVTGHENNKNITYCDECCAISGQCEHAVIQDHSFWEFRWWKHDETTPQEYPQQVWENLDKFNWRNLWWWLGTDFVHGVISTFLWPFLNFKIWFSLYFVSSLFNAFFLYRANWMTCYWISYLIFSKFPVGIQNIILKYYARRTIRRLFFDSAFVIKVATALSLLLVTLKGISIGKNYFKLERTVKGMKEEFKTATAVRDYEAENEQYKKKNGRSMSEDSVEELESFERLCMERNDIPAPESPLQGGAASVVDMYYNDTEPSVSWDFGAKVTSWKPLGHDEVLSKISENVVRMQGAQNDGRVKVGHGIFVEGQILMTNFHLFGGVKRFRISMDRNTKRDNWFPVPSTDIIEVPEQDLMFIRFRNVPPHRRVWDLFPKNYIYDAKTACTIISRVEQTSELLFHGSKSCHYYGEGEVSHEKFGTQKFKYYAMPCNTTINGDCGSPYVLNSPYGSTIIGVHQKLESGHAFCIAIKQDDILEPIKIFRDGIQGGSIIRPTLSFALQPLSKDSNLRRIENPCTYIFGTSQRRFPSSSRVTKTLIYQDCVEKGWADEFGKPVMRNRRVWIQQLEPMVDREFNLDVGLLYRARDMYISEIMEEVTDFSSVRILNEDESLNGIIGVDYINKIPRKTSAGFPFNKSKMFFIDIEDDGRATMNEEIRKDMEAIDAIVRGGERSMAVFMASLKDETLSKKKVDSMSTRVFTGCPFAFSLIMRKYLLTIVALVQNNRSTFECCAGVDASGPEWEEIQQWLTSFGRNAIAGDYKNYDKKMVAALILEAGSVCIAICEKAGYSEEDITAVKSIFYDIAFPVCNFDGDIIMTCGAEPSGHPLTVIVNSLVGALLLRMAYINLGIGTPFKRNVRAIIYGDDNAMISRIPEFNHTYLQTFFANQGIIYTMADKEAESVPFIDFDEVTFLKRDFFFNEELGHVVGRLDQKSIHKMLMYRVPKGTMDSENHAVEVLDTSCKEMFFYGKEKFNEHRNWCLSLIAKYELEQCVSSSHFRDYTAFVDWYQGKWEEFGHSSFVSEIQDGESRIFTGCTVCGFDDCVNPQNPVICRRCHHCRSSRIVTQDQWFLGCEYCEDMHPLWCDSCSEVHVFAQVYFDDNRTTFFMCRTCYRAVTSRSDYIAALGQSNNPLPRDLPDTSSVSEQLLECGIRTRFL